MSHEHGGEFVRRSRTAAGMGTDVLIDGCPKRLINSARAAPGLMAAPGFVGTVFTSTIEHEQQSNGSKRTLSNE